MIVEVDVTTAATAWLGLRVAYLACYSFGIPVLRSGIWARSIVCMICMALTDSLKPRKLKKLIKRNKKYIEGISTNGKDSSRDNSYKTCGLLGLLLFIGIGQASAAELTVFDQGAARLYWDRGSAPLIGN